MKPEEIRVGITYVNKWKGRTTREVLAIGTKYIPRYRTSGYEPGEPAVIYFQFGTSGGNACPLSQFAAWAGKAVGNE